MHGNQVILQLDPASIARLKRSAKEAQKLENKWDRKIKEDLEATTDYVLDYLAEYGEMPNVDFEKILIEHSFAVSMEAIRIAEAGEFELKPEARLSLPKAKIPKTLSDLMELYDRWKHGLYKPKRPKAIAERIKKAYVKKCQDVWKRYSEDFRNGDEYTQELVKKKIREAAKTTTSRAQTIVRTETTNYYNDSRKKYYDQSDEVTHYLFLAIRDDATTAWCTPNYVKGKRGRHGLVYVKGDPLLEKEKPACHWNCRSELLPLTPMNPAHLKLIKNASIQRRNVTCTPLPPNWRAA